MGALLFVVCLSRAGAGQEPPSTGSPMNGNNAVVPADVALLIIPTTPTTARLGLAYRTRVPHTRVRQELARLSEGTGWQIGSDLVVSDSSVNPRMLRQFPVTTSAMVTLRNAPQFPGGAPALMVYLRAFQKWNHVEALFHNPLVTPQEGAIRFDSKALSVQLTRGPGILQYEADIRDHAGALPAPTSATTPAFHAPSPQAKTQETTRAATKASSGAISPVVYLLLLGAALSGGLGIYLLVTRRTPRNPTTARTLRL